MERARSCRRWLIGALVAAALVGATYALRRELMPVAARLAAILPRAVARPLARGEESLRDACRTAGFGYPPPEPRVVIAKPARILALYSGDVLVKEYAVGLGGDPLPDKEREGDRRTPVGDFYICTRLERSRWHRFLGISYPGPEDAERGRQEGTIRRAEQAAILRAHRRRLQPPWKTALGGEVGIHGGGSGLDWTWGCIALENEAVAELFPVLSLGTPVRIE